MCIYIGISEEWNKMIINHSYKVSAFGEFVDIQPTPENMLTLLEEFNKMDLLPSVYDELSTSNEEAIPKSRLALLSSNKKERFLIGSTRIDYEVLAQDDTDLEKDKLHDYIERAKEIYSIIIKKYDINFSRLALNTEINLYNDMLPKFYDGKEKNEFKVHLLTRITEKINSVDEILNINTSMNKSTFRTKEAIVTNGFSAAIDINTLFENKKQRFGSSEMNEFVKKSFAIWNEIIDDLGDKFECINK